MQRIDGHSKRKTAEQTLYFVIPIYNEAKNISRLVDNIARQASDRQWTIIAVDDGSSDESRSILDGMTSQLGDRLIILSHPSNLGVPEAFYTGYSAAAQMADDKDFIICNEGDGTSDPILIDDMLRSLDSTSDIVIASRYIPGGGWVGFPWHRRLISRYGNLALRLIFPYPGITDFSIFYRGYRANLVKKVLARHGRAAFGGKHFSANTAFLMACLEQRPRITETANMYVYHIKKSSSAFRLRTALAGYTPLVFSSRSWRLRRLCLQEKKKRTAARKIPVDEILATHRVLCPTCGRELRGTVMSRANRVVFRAQCPADSSFEETHWADPATYRLLEKTRNLTAKDPAAATRPSLQHLQAAKSVFIDLTRDLAPTMPENRQSPSPAEWIRRSLADAADKKNVFLLASETAPPEATQTIIRTLQADGHVVKLLLNDWKRSGDGPPIASTDMAPDWLCPPAASLPPEVLEQSRWRRIKLMLTSTMDADSESADIPRILELAFREPSIMHVALASHLWPGRIRPGDAANPEDLFRRLEATSQGRITRWDFLRFRRLSSRLHRLTGRKIFFQPNCFFPLLLMKTADGYFPITRFFKPRFAWRHFTSLIRLLKKIPRLSNWDKMEIDPDLKLISIEIFHSEKLLNLDEINHCQQCHLTVEGFMPACTYYRLYAHEATKKTGQAESTARK